MKQTAAGANLATSEYAVAKWNGYLYELLCDQRPLHFALWRIHRGQKFLSRSSNM